MTTIPHAETRSERGIALVVVLLLMAVLSGLATGFAMNGKVESSMAQNEGYYAGARAAAEAGINRATAAIRLEEAINLLTGEDGLEGTADDGDVGFLLTGGAPYALDAAGQYSYSIEILDDDDPALYNGVALNAAQLVAMGNEGNGGVPDPSTDHNTRLILRATGFGPSNTMVRVSRVLLTTIIPIPGSTVNPAILIDGDVSIDGNINLLGDYGSIHANGDLTVNGMAATVEGDATASGDFSGNNNFAAGGTQGGGYSNINVPEVTSSDYAGIADYILHDDGSQTLADGVTACGATCAEWTFSGGTWELAGNDAPEGTFYVEGKVSISGSPKGPGNTALNVTIIATGTIDVSGSPKFTPDDDNNPEAIQFVTDGDLKLAGSSDLDDPTQVEGQIFVREQIQTNGTIDFQGRIIVQNDANLFDDVISSSFGGTPTITYEGSLPGYVIPPTTEYTYNVTGWIEQ
jgi:hypothetical protein